MEEIASFLAATPPYDTLSPEKRQVVAARMRRLEMRSGTNLYEVGDRLEGLYFVASGEVDVHEAGGGLVSRLGPGDCFGERGLMRDGAAATSARAASKSALYLLSAADFHRLRRTEPLIGRFFDRARAPAEPKRLEDAPASAIMNAGVLTCGPDAAASDIARLMRDARISCVAVVEAERLIGLVTTTDLTNRVLAEGLSGDALARDILSPDPATLDPKTSSADALRQMIERGIGHLPVVSDGALLGMITRRDLLRWQAPTSASLVHEIAAASDIDGVAAAARRIPQLLAHLIASGQRHQAATRMITDIADAVTRRLLAMAQERLGPAPVPWLWLACGSQGRQEQSGVSDQDNCLFLDDAATPEDDAYFAELAQFVSDGLNACGYVYCPGEMMATTARWRQPMRVWRAYFAGWVRKPDPMAQMLASVMFDLRPIAGDERLFTGVQAETLEMASRNSIFVAHMVSNALKHAPPLGMFGGLARIRSGAHKNRVDLKLTGVAPVADLGRIYALQSRLTPVNTRERLKGAIEAQAISEAGGRDLLDAYDLIADIRLRHQAGQVRAGEKPDNFMAPDTLSDLERSHLRDAFVVIRTMQSALAYGRSAVL